MALRCCKKIRPLFYEEHTELRAQAAVYLEPPFVDFWACHSISRHTAAQARRHIIVKTAREETARNAVEVIEVAEASLDHGEQISRSLVRKHRASPALKVANCSVSDRRAFVWSSFRCAMRRDESRHALGRRPLAGTRTNNE